MKRKDSNPIHLIKAAQAAPFVHTLERLGAPIESLSLQAGMPLDAVLKRKGVIGERSLWRFVGYAAEQQKLDHLGYMAAVEHPVDSAGELGGLRMRMAPTLGKLLEFFIEDVQGESTGTYYSLRHSKEHTWFHRTPIFPDSEASWQAEQYVITFVIQIVRLCAGDRWLPPRLHITSSKRPLRLPDEWSEIDIGWGHSATEIAIEEQVMALPSGDASSELDRRHDRKPGDEFTVLDIAYLVDRQIWSGRTSIDEAADELGLSVTTLKRRLRETGKPYSTVVDNRRLYWAGKLLGKTDMPIRDIARTLGYKHASNFTRAFERIAGMSPSAFRKRSDNQ